MSHEERAGETLRIVFMGTPQFAVPSLQALLRRSSIAGRLARVVAVVTQPDRPAGRGQRLQESPVKAVAREAGVPVLQPERLRRAESTAELRSYAPDLIVVAAFAQILSRTVLDMPAYGCLNVHASLLPRWRGAAPIPAAILAGDRETGVTIMQMDPGLDTGPILSQRAEPIYPDDTTATLTARLAVLGADLLDATLDGWIAGTITPRRQDEAQATLTRPLARDDGRVQWNVTPATTIERMTRAYQPWPGAYTIYKGRVLKLWDVQPFAVTGIDLRGKLPGYILIREEALPILHAQHLPWPQLLVATVDGALLLRRVQPEGKRAMGGDEFMRGQQDAAGAVLV